MTAPCPIHGKDSIGPRPTGRVIMKAEFLSVRAFAAAGLLLAAPAPAQDIASLRGEWSGAVTDFRKTSRHLPEKM